MPEIVLATGRRKTSVAQIRLKPDGDGKVQINSKTLEDYFGGNDRFKLEVMAPLKTAGISKFDLSVKVEGGGIHGQSQAIRHGIARALVKIDEKFRKLMRREGFLTRDPRMVERKKPGRPKARKRFQYSKR